MLNISNNSIKDMFPEGNYASLRKIKRLKSGKLLLRTIGIISFMGMVILFLPWTQNINTKGKLTTKYPSQRPQTINSVIGGKIEKWFVNEGQWVETGDTILFISEIKDQYFDPDLLSRTQEQMNSKERALNSYVDKANALENQKNAAGESAKLKLLQSENKLRQARLKVVSDSIDYEASKVSFSISEKQLQRTESLYNEGLKSLTEVEIKKNSYQKALADKISYESKLLASRNEEINATIELSAVKAEYQDKISKIESERYSALSNVYDSEISLTKLRNQYTNYSFRNNLYYITAPQSGYITKTIKTGIGETLKEGDEILQIMPAEYELVVETYVRPIDLPLIRKGQKVRLQFDGWPAIVFSGWPNTSYGTYGGVVYAIDNYISENGRYRILVEPDPADHAWPDPLRAGTGSKSFMLLNDVPIWYEIWRNINGFPPDYYSQEMPLKSKK